MVRFAGVWDTVEDHLQLVPVVLLTGPVLPHTEMKQAQIKIPGTFKVLGIWRDVRLYTNSPRSSFAFCSI